MSLKRANLISLAFVVASFAVVEWFWGRLPDPYPTHWNIHGEADGFTAMPWGALLVPVVQALVWVVLAAAPWISPRKFRFEQSTRAFGSIFLVASAFLTATTAVGVADALGRHQAVGRMLPIAVGALLIGLGNYLGKTTPNFFVGVRTPWTLASPLVWERTHRLAAWMFVATGLVVMIVGALSTHASLAMGLVLVPALVPAAYSYVVYRRLEGFKRDGDEA
jgi:uncharacterized membrane protein